MIMSLISGAMTLYLPCVTHGGMCASPNYAIRACAAGNWWDDYPWESGVTCVEYEAGGEVLLGVYIRYSVVEDRPHICPLCSSAAEDGVRVLFQDEESATAPLSAVRRVLDPDYVFVSERQAGGGQGLGNPHGEHGEECYDLSDVDLSPNVRVVVREGRDTQRVL